MELATIIDQYYDAFIAKHTDTLLTGHLRALNAIRRCRTPDSGELHVQCPDCGRIEWRPMSCGHRSCPKCQNHEASQWIDRQQAKLLPAPYFMATFTLPYELRPLSWRHQKAVYSILFTCAAGTPQGFRFESEKPGC
jgi:hypothetical protein